MQTATQTGTSSTILCRLLDLSSLAEAVMLPKGTAELAAKVAKRRESILTEPHSYPASEVEAARHINGLPVYGDLGGVIALTLSGEFVLYNPESETVTPVEDALWVEVALASLGRHYPELRDLLPERPAGAAVCPNCSGSGWLLDGRLFCRRCRGLGWIE
jgi:hypothetical protein